VFVPEKKLKYDQFTEPVALPGLDPYNLSMPFVYILRCSNGSFYTGSTTDLERRLQQHQSGQASKYTRSRLPVTLCWVREVDSWSEALVQEHRIKTLSRAQKQALIAVDPERRCDTP
jgi:putative endonuclease